MSFLNLLYTILIGPLQLFFEVIYSLAYRVIHNEGLCIVILSLAMNFLVLPLYRRADALQAEERDTELRLKKGVDHIRKTFKGDDRMMILQTYYRQNHYKPMDALKGSFSLLLEIPFFIAAYRFLSNLTILQGVGFGPIRDLGAADGLLVLGGVSINALPVLMTVINLISSAIYTKGFPVKTKVQLYGMALFFLVFLYKSPAGLVFYWTLNNLFSLAKTIFYKIRNASFCLEILASAAGILTLAGAFCMRGELSAKVFLVFLLLGLALQLPVCLHVLGKRKPAGKSAERTSHSASFLGASLVLTVLVGILIPSAVIRENPLEFIDSTYFFNPLWYVVYALCLSAGVFLIWFRVFHSLANERGKYLFERGLVVCAVLAIVNYMYFGRSLGIMNSSLIFDKGLVYTQKDNLVNLVVLAGAFVVTVLLIRFFKARLVPILFIAVIAIGGMGISNLVKVQAAVTLYNETVTDREEPVVTLSKNSQNVIVIMLDRAMGLYLPYIMQEKPELQEQFDGFTYYNNVISFGGSTNLGSPAVFGGYEYRPDELNKRDTEVMRVKHNEALSVMPTLFSKWGYDVTLLNPSCANYQWIPDLSIFEDADFKSYVTYGLYSSVESKESTIAGTKRNFFCYSLMKVMPVFLQPTVYNEGAYNALTDASAEEIYVGQSRTGTSIASGLEPEAMDYYNTLRAMPHITRISDSDTGSFLLYVCELSHAMMFYEEPSYEPKMEIDNTEYDAAHRSRFTVDGRTIPMETTMQMATYHANMASMIQIGKWLDYLRENDVYDNTRIIIAADHGWGLQQIPELILDESDSWLDGQYYFPLLMVKDFNTSGFYTSEEFMTNADVPTLACAGLIENPINPFTGKAIDSTPKYTEDMYILTSAAGGIKTNNSSVLLPGNWLKVHDNIWERENWEIVQRDSTSPTEHVEFDAEKWMYYKEPE